MNRNTELHFSQTPLIDIKRSKFEESHSHKTTFNVGDVVPIFVDADILPGDTVQMNMASLIRMATPIYPIMDNLYADIYFFFIPHRLVWDHWAEFWGENEDPWTQTTEYEIPQITAPTNGWTEGTIADYMGIPTKVGNISVNALPFRAYCKCWNDWFRSENLKNNTHIYMDETTRQGKNGNESGYNYVTGTELGGKPVKAAKMHDYFTSALPEPQKGQPVQIPLGSVAPVNATSSAVTLTGKAPIVTSTNYHTYGDTHLSFRGVTLSTSDFRGLALNGNSSGYGIVKIPQAYVDDGGVSRNVQYSDNTQMPIPNNLWFDTTKGGNNKITGSVDFNNVYADLSHATAATVNQLRTAFAIQKYFENAALHGTRYIEYIRGVFGVSSSDARMQRAEYLGGQRIPINIEQIIQTSSTDTTSPQGNTAGFSCTINRDSMFTKSFEEHGTLLGLCVIRTEHTYQQGLDKMWTRKKWTDFYNPFFAHLGEQAILNENIFAQGTAKDKEAFGYQEAWAEYRYKNNRVSGYMRSNASGSLDVWHFADDYGTLPLLSSEWIDEPYNNVDRTIAVTSQLTHQFIADFFYKCYYTRPMPVYSIPGLIDHV